MTMFENSSMTVTVEDCIVGLEGMLKSAQEDGRRAAVRMITRMLEKTRAQTNEEWRAEMGLEPV